MRHPSESAPAGGSISIGGNVSCSAVVAGAAHRVTVVTHGTPEAVLVDLRAIRAALDGMRGPAGDAARRDADAALAAAAHPPVDKNLIGGALGRALEAARTTEEFAERAVRLARPLHDAVAWLGDAWSHLRVLLP